MASKCRECGRPIVWVRTRAGRSMPCDPGLRIYWAAEGAPGKILTPQGDLISCTLEGDERTGSGVGYLPHWGSCPGAETIRRQTKERRASI